MRKSNQKNEPKPTKQGGDRAIKGKVGSRTKKRKADQNKKVRTMTWVDVVKG